MHKCEKFEWPWLYSMEDGSSVQPGRTMLWLPGSHQY